MLIVEVQAKLSYSPEVAAAIGAGRGYATTFRRITKRHESITTASPYSVSVVGFCDSFLYCQGVLCYTLDDKLRILDLHGSHGHETVVCIPDLLREFLPEPEEDISGRFRILHFNEGIISCLYKISAADSVAYLVVLDLKGQILLNHRLEATEKIFARHNSKVLYYGIYTGDINDRHKKWVLRGCQLEEKSWFDHSIYLPELIGSDIGATVCFEIIGDYFYALSNQTTSDVEEVDWTSFYHCARFPTKSPCKELIEKTLEDEHMWRRQHREGPIDDRWASLSLHLDESSGHVNIVETRREFTAGASNSQRTCYTTRVVFPDRLYTEVCEQPLVFSSDVSSYSSGSTLGSTDTTTEISSSFPVSSIPSTRRLEKYELAAVTNDRLALTLTASDNPHWFPPQYRLPRNVHLCSDGPFVLSKTPLRYYNASAGSFIDLVDDRLPDQPEKQRLRLRVCSRKLAPPTRNMSGLVIPEKRDCLTNDPLPGHNEMYSPRDVALWPPEPRADGPPEDALEDWYTLLNPPSHQGNVEGTADSRSILFVTGGSQKDQPKAMVFINNDPTIQLQGLERWGFSANTSSFPHEESHRSRGGSAASAFRYSQGSPNPTIKVQRKEKGKAKMTNVDAEVHAPLEATECLFSETELGKRSGSGFPAWMRTEPAMYTVIKRGYNFGWFKSN